MCKILLQVRAAARPDGWPACACCMSWRGYPTCAGKLLFQYCCLNKSEFPTSFIFLLTLPWMHPLHISTLLTLKRVYTEPCITNPTWTLLAWETAGIWKGGENKWERCILEWLPHRIRTLWLQLSVDPKRVPFNEMWPQFSTVFHELK